MKDKIIELINEIKDSIPADVSVKILPAEYSPMETDIKDCFAAVNQILSYLNKYEGSSGETYWNDKNGNGFRGDMGYFFDGLYELKYYCEKQIK